jgi:hypothetical protein
LNTQSKKWSIVIFFFFLINLSCKEKHEYPSQEIIQKYQKNAHIFCKAVVDCFKEDAGNRLKGNPERTQLLTLKMDMDLCRENQYNLIGKTYVAIKPSSPIINEELYKSYENCAIAVESEKDCKSRFTTYKTHADCMRIKQKH